MCTRTHSLYFDFVLKNKERSIILHLKNVQSFTVGKFIDMIETIFFFYSKYSIANELSSNSSEFRETKHCTL